MDLHSYLCHLLSLCQLSKSGVWNDRSTSSAQYLLCLTIVFLYILFKSYVYGYLYLLFYWAKFVCASPEVTECELEEVLQWLQITRKFWLEMKSKGVLVLWWEARLYPTWLLLTKGIQA